MRDVEAHKLIAVMTAALPREWSFLSEKQREETSKMYARMLEDVPYPPANVAVEALLATATKMPTIAEIREGALRIMHGPVRPGGDAWGDVRKLSTFRNVGDLSGVDEIVLRTCERMGWIKHRTLFRGGQEIEQWHVETGEHEPSDRAQFIALHDKLAAEDRHEQNTSQLPAAKRFRVLQGEQHNEQPKIERPRAESDPVRVDFLRLLPPESGDAQ